MKLRRTLEDWQRLIEQQKTSGLSIVGFCKQNKLPTSNFYKYRNRLKASEQTPTLVKVKIGCSQIPQMEQKPVPCFTR